MAAAPSREKLKQWLAWEKERLEFQRKASDLGKLQGALEEELFAYVKAEGGKERCVVRFGFRLLLKDKRENVSWKGEFVKEHGQAEAAKLIAAQPTSETLVVEPPAS
jgi:hypothetical protein